MRISTRGEYGVRAMFELAMNYGQGPIPLNVIAERQRISEPYLEQLMAALRKAELVKSFRGAQGGYELARTPQEICVGDIIRTLEGPIAPMECVESDREFGCGQSSGCATRNLWQKLKDSIEDVLDNTTLDCLCQETRQSPDKADPEEFNI